MSNPDLEKLQQLLRKEIQCHQVSSFSVLLLPTWLLLELKTRQSKRSQYPCICSPCVARVVVHVHHRMQMSLNALTRLFYSIKTSSCFHPQIYFSDYFWSLQLKVMYIELLFYSVEIYEVFEASFCVLQFRRYIICARLTFFQCLPLSNAVA